MLVENWDKLNLTKPLKRKVRDFPPGSVVQILQEGNLYLICSGSFSTETVAINLHNGTFSFDNDQGVFQEVDARVSILGPKAQGESE